MTRRLPFDHRMIADSPCLPRRAEGKCAEVPAAELFTTSAGSMSWAVRGNQRTFLEALEEPLTKMRCKPLL